MEKIYKMKNYYLQLLEETIVSNANRLDKFLSDTFIRQFLPILLRYEMLAYDKIVT